MCVRPSVAAGGKESACSLGAGSTGGWVEHCFFRAWSKWPLIIVAKRGGCFWRERMERPGNAGNKCFPRADHLRVDKAGENKVAWAKAMSWAGLADWLVVLACYVTVGGVGSQGVRGTGDVGKSTLHSFLTGERILFHRRPTPEAVEIVHKLQYHTISTFIHTYPTFILHIPFSTRSSVTTLRPVLSGFVHNG
jgi:hypothetical protein